MHRQCAKLMRCFFEARFFATLFGKPGRAMDTRLAKPPVPRHHLLWPMIVLTHGHCGYSTARRRRCMRFISDKESTVSWPLFTNLPNLRWIVPDHDDCIRFHSHCYRGCCTYFIAIAGNHERLKLIGSPRSVRIWRGNPYGISRYTSANAMVHSHVEWRRMRCANDPVLATGTCHRLKQQPRNQYRRDRKRDRTRPRSTLDQRLVHHRGPPAPPNGPPRNRGIRKGGGTRGRSYARARSIHSWGAGAAVQTPVKQHTARRLHN